jgi:two-component sensor histidine kinase
MSRLLSPAPFSLLEHRLVQIFARGGLRDEVLNRIVFAIQDGTGFYACDLLLRQNGEGLVLKASTANPELTNRMKLGKNVGLCGFAFLDQQNLFLERDAPKDKRYAKYAGTEDVDWEAVVVLPLLREKEEPVGVLVVRHNTPRQVSEDERQRLQEIAQCVSGLVQGYDRAYEVGAKSNRLGALSEVTKTISNSPYLEEILQLLVNITAQQFNYTVCTVRLLDENRGELVLRATQAPAKAYQRKRAIKLGESIAGRAINENRPIIVPDVQVEEDYIGHDLAVEQGLRSMICVPLMVRDKPVGVMSCYTSTVREFSPDETKALETLAKQAAVSIEHAKLQVRNTLMQEMHHRVKNNLQQVASLLRLQMRHSSYKSIEEALNDCLTRILAIASVHDLLSRDDLDHVGIRSVAETLVQHQQSSLVLPDRSIMFLVRGHDVRLNMTQATQIALVLNELISNAVEHGFKESVKGEIHVTVEDLEGEISVWVSNNGDRLPENFDPTVQGHLGMQIVDSLARALGGRFKIGDVLEWTVAEVRFPRHTGE